MTEELGTALETPAVTWHEPEAPRHPLVHTPASPPVRGLVWELIDLDCYAVGRDGVALGFVDVVGRVYVSLAGARYCRAVEVAQSLSFERAVAAVVAAHGGR
ncbi:MULTISPECIES: hypothetical protein [Microbacterium]|uniref:hypothetical protein n=1 Tax=Microbacterium TaxID=33882 RepID=UPI001EF6CCBD|nr:MULTISPECIES: hypothetical protein [Microbacterium]MCG7414453.1 hypothetical protein [Microbacterium aurum]